MKFELEWFVKEFGVGIEGIVKELEGNWISLCLPIPRSEFISSL